MLVCLGGGGRIDSIRKGRKRDKQEKSDAPRKVQGQSILTLGKSVSSQCSTQFRSLFPCQVFWRLIPFRACCDHAYGRNILATLRGNFLGQLVLVVIINNHTSIRFLQLQNLNFGIAQLIFRAQARPHLPLRQMAVVPCIRWTALGS